MQLYIGIIRLAKLFSLNSLLGLTIYINLSLPFIVSPIIENDEISNLTVREGDNVVLTCGVHASPKATVRWEMSQDDVICNLDDRHNTDYLNTHRQVFSVLIF